MKKLKNKIKKFFSYFFMLFSYPEKVASAVNSVHTKEELDAFVSGGNGRG